jgi:hypothetical protein
LLLLAKGEHKDPTGTATIRAPSRFCYALSLRSYERFSSMSLFHLLSCTTLHGWMAFAAWLACSIQFPLFRLPRQCSTSGRARCPPMALSASHILTFLLRNASRPCLLPHSRIYHFLWVTATIVPTYLSKFTKAAIFRAFGVCILRVLPALPALSGHNSHHSYCSLYTVI